MFGFISFVLRVLAKVALIILIINTITAVLLERSLSIQELLAFEDLNEKFQFLVEIIKVKVNEYAHRI